MFKNSFLEKTELYQPDTLQIDSLILVREKLPNVRVVKTFVKNSNSIYHEYFHNGTTQLESTTFYDTLDKPKGIFKQYSNEGELDYTFDYDSGQWTVHNRKDYPYYDLQLKLKWAADSLISKMYGLEFLKKHAIWCVLGSWIHNADESGIWTDKFKEKPTRFSFSYNIQLDSIHRYDELIHFELDEKGRLVPNPEAEGYGFENVPSYLKGQFKITYENAIEKSKELGLVEDDTTKAIGILRWEDFKKEKIFSGQFRFYVMIQTKIIEILIPKGRSSRTIKYDIYSFNPWTGEFVEKKKMKSIYSWESMSGSGSGLIPDNE